VLYPLVFRKTQIKTMDRSSAHKLWQNILIIGEDVKQPEFMVASGRRVSWHNLWKTGFYTLGKVGCMYPVTQ
jgi:hypothetical protein